MSKAEAEQRWCGGRAAAAAAAVATAEPARLLHPPRVAGQPSALALSFQRRRSCRQSSVRGAALNAACASQGHCAGSAHTTELHKEAKRQRAAAAAMIGGGVRSMASAEHGVPSMS